MKLRRIILSIIAVLTALVIWAGLPACSTTAPVTTEVKLDLAKKIMTERRQQYLSALSEDYRNTGAGKTAEQRIKPVTKDEVISLLGPPVKTQMFLGVLYMLYRTSEKDVYVVIVDEHRHDAGFVKVDPGDEKLKKVFGADVDEYGFPRDGSFPGTPPEKTETRKVEQKEIPEEARVASRDYYSKAKEEKDGQKAIRYYSKAIEADPGYGEAYAERGELYYEAGNYARAFDDLGKALDLKPESSLYKSVAWKLATCKDSKYRDGKKASEYALKSVRMQCPRASHYPKFDNTCSEYFHVLAAAYAEEGKFPQAAALEKMVNDSYYPLFPKEEEIKKDIERALQAYKNDRTYRQMEDERQLQR